MHFSPAELNYFQRQFPVIGTSGQEKLKAAKVLCIGAGGLGSPVLLYLSAMGVGTLGIVDFDFVELSNLSRQVIHRFSSLGQAKVKSAEQTIASINPWTTVDLIEKKITAENADNLIEGYDLVVDGSDNFSTRYLINDACLRQNKPLVSASLFRWEGHLSVFNFQNGPCYRCIFPEPRESLSCAEAGIIGSVAGLLGSLQATEVVKVILGEGEILSEQLLVINVLENHFKKIKIEKNTTCVCTTKDFSSLKNIVMNNCFDGNITSESLRKKLSEKPNNFLLIDVRTKEEHESGHIPESIHFPLGLLQEGTYPEVASHQEIVVYCAGGFRSQQAVELLNAKGFMARSLGGGFQEWLKQGFEKNNSYAI